MKRTGFFIHVVPALLYVGAIFYGGTVNPANVPAPQVQFADKWMHFVAFGFMVFVLRRAIAFQWPRVTPRQALVWSAVGASAIGALLEIVQMFTTTRSAEFLDWVADTIGAILAAILLHRLFLARASSTS